MQIRTFLTGFFLQVYSILAAQSPETDSLLIPYHQYQHSHLQEVIFVHTGKTFYLSGEILWFKVYSVDEVFHRLLSISRIAYIELVDGEGKPVLQTRVSMKGGLGEGSFMVPASLVSGNYIFRAYTSWMKNFAPDFYFHQEIQVANTLRVVKSKPNSPFTRSIRFFPEGGRNVNGIGSKMAFKVEDPYGLGLDCQGLILDQFNDTVLRFQSLHNGMGSFVLKPEKDRHYYALIHVGDSVIRQKLPEAEAEGYTLRAVNVENDSIKITIQASEVFNNKAIYLFTHTRQLVRNVQTGILKNGSAEFYLDRKWLGDGISVITLFNAQRQAVAERLIFKRPEDTLSVHAETSQQGYRTRSPVKVLVNTQDTTHIASSANLSVSVFLIDSLQALPEQNILNYLFLSADLKGRVQSPDYYFTHKDKMAEEALDNLLLTQGWRRFSWKEVFDERKPGLEFLPEMEGSIVNGRVINRRTGSAIGNSVAYLSMPGHGSAFSSATSDTQGNLRFGFPNISNNNVLVVQPAMLKDSENRVEISPVFSEKFAERHLPVLEFRRTQENILLSRSIGNQVENTYGLGKKRRFLDLWNDTLAFYGKPDRLYNLDEYTRFQTMEEVLREFIEDLRVRKDGERFSFRVRNSLFGTYFEEDPLILLDGIPLTDASKIVALNPLKIKKIEIVTHNYYLGSSLFAGIVNVESYQGDLGISQISPSALVLDYERLQQQREFYSPAYPAAEDRASHMPDFRNLLYWSPRMETATDGKAEFIFYTSDTRGRFAMIIQGISANGQPGTAVSFFDVGEGRQ